MRVQCLFLLISLCATGCDLFDLPFGAEGLQVRELVLRVDGEEVSTDDASISYPENGYFLDVYFDQGGEEAWFDLSWVDSMEDGKSTNPEEFTMLLERGEVTGYLNTGMGEDGVFTLSGAGTESQSVEAAGTLSDGTEIETSFSLINALTKDEKPEYDFSGSYKKTNPKNASEPAGAAIDFSGNDIILCDWEEGFGVLYGEYRPDSSTIKLRDYPTIYDVVPDGEGFTLKVGDTGTGVYVPVASWSEATAEATLDCGAGW